ncbi:ASKHA domain-containing protein [Candidatus Solincola tengchongensis]|uniref:ASKHA domain-containing protein n=1 Tax=Candidatus Solincola tengchongensis TaxID=2900693 RepID=UPI00257A4F17|nr:ASKHA domain-containing protein [Candidatus Solincola tengchongensis]
MEDTCRVLFLPDNRYIVVPRGENLLKAAMDADVHVNASCGGSGSCGKCRVVVEEGEVEREPNPKLTESEIAQGYALACQARVLTDLQVRIPIESRIGDKRIFERKEPVPAHGYLLSAADWEKRLPHWELNPSTRKIHLVLPPPTLDDNVSDAERVKRGLAMEAGLRDVVIDYPVLQRLPNMLRQSDWDITVTVLDSGEELRAVRIEQGDTTERQSAIAIDVGTTTISAELIDLRTGEVTARASDYNAQVAFGEDVITRIIYATRGTGLAKLQSVVVGTIWNLIKTLVEQAGIEYCNITHLVVAGNTTMTHLLLGLNPKYIREEPYIPSATFFPWIKCSDIGLRIAAGVYLYAIPCVASYVGGDIVAGMLASGIFNTDKLTLYIDIGTNGEMVLGNREWMLSCSCSAGPAFEGGGVKHGMRATRGAIEQVRINPGNYEPMIITVGNRKPIGICGSGLIDALSEMFMTGIINEKGKINTDLPTDRVRATEGGAEYVLVRAEDSATRRDIVITEVDIDNLMRAKAAVYAGIEILLSSVDMDVSMIDELLIAGAFGRYLEVDKAVNIGLLPDIGFEKMKFVGNGSLLGAHLSALSKDMLEKANEIARQMTYLELSMNPAFMEHYLSALFFPHTNLDAFPSVKKKLEARRKVRYRTGEAASAGEVG